VTEVNRLRGTRGQKRLFLIFGGTAVVLCVALGVGVWLLGTFVITPTQTVHVRNDLSVALQVSLCGSDPVSIESGETGSVDPYPNDANAACVIYGVSVDDYLGCLLIPTTVYRDGATVLVSQMKSGIPLRECERFSQSSTAVP
jgi:hypothetical protein